MKVIWGADVERRLRSMPARDAAMLYAAVHRFARRSGDVDLVPAEGSLFRRLRVGGYRIVMVLAPGGSSVWVVRLYRVDR